MSARRLRRFVREYGEAAASMTHAEVRRYQPGPHATLAYGTGGLAFALWHVARGRDAALLAAARRLTAELNAGRAAADHHLDGAVLRPESFYCGRLGGAVLRALTAGAPLRRRPPAALAELMQGRAGQLAACSLVGRGGDALAADLLRHLVETPLDDPDDGVAHGWAGIALVLLGWARAAGQAPPAKLRQHLLARARGPELPARRGSFMDLSWCNGAAGHALLWARAHQASGAPALRDRAIAEAERLTRWTGEVPAVLCCGRVGWAYAYAAVDEIDPGAGWRTRALGEADEMAATPRGYTHPNGLFWGVPALYCLCADLADGAPPRFPAVEPP